ncbi:MAG TPA: pyridoxamine 5'-phosphate oxidase family protein [Nocardioidaceae bacterium]|nr:pyridoxamine 5'-phosphate oxidase family protein [Nocardioidaceae bacterium]
MTNPPRRLTRLTEKQSAELADLHRLLDDTYLGHVAHRDGDEVTVTPTAVARLDDSLVWHGSTGSRWMRLLASGEPVAVSVAQLDGVVVARSRFESSFWYRSAVVRGRPVALEGDQLLRALDTLVERIIPGRLAETRESDGREIAATLVLAVPLDDWVLKVSDSWPEDTPEDLEGDAWAGVVPLGTEHGAPLPAPDLRRSIDVPPSVRGLGSPSD